MTLQQINYFRAVCEDMHYTKAANRIHVSQPSLSYAVRELERELGVTLLKKTAKKIELTEYGEIFYQHARKIQQDLDSAIKAIEAKKKESQRQINIGYLFSVSADFLAPMIGKYFDYVGRHDQVFNFVPYKMSQIAEGIHLGGIDIAFATDDVEPSLADTQLTMVHVYQQELFLVVPKNHPFAERSSITFDEIKQESFVAINPGKGLRVQMDQYFRNMNAQPRIVFSVDDSASLLSYIEVGVGIGIMPKLPKMNLDKVSLLQISDHPIQRNVVMIYSKSRAYSAETRNLISFFQLRKFN